VRVVLQGLNVWANCVNYTDAVGNMRNWSDVQYILVGTQLVHLLIGHSLTESTDTCSLLSTDSCRSVVS
jgi:hypothetical protein